MYKVCFVTQTLDYKNGYGRYSLNLINELSKKKIFGPIIVGETSPIPEKLGKRTYALLKHQSTAPFNNPINIVKDWYYIQKISRDCKFIHFITESNLATTILPFKKPYMVTSHGTWAIKPLTRPLTRLVFMPAYQHALDVVSISSYTQNQLKKYLGNNINYSKIISGINQNQFHIKTQNGNIHSPLRLLSIGAFYYSKGYQISIKAGMIASANMPITQTVISSNIDYQLYRQLKEESNNYPNYKLKLVENASDSILKKELSQADIYILTPVNIDNDFEGLGLNYIEAISANLPIIASRSGGIPEVVKHYKTGLLVKENSISDTKKAIITLARNSSLRKTIIHNARNTLPNFTVARMATDYLNLYAKI